MSTQHRLREAAARCLTILQSYHDAGRTEASEARMAAEVDMLIGYLMELGLPPGMAEAGVLEPVAKELLARHGPEAGRRLGEEFVGVFGRAGMPLIYKGGFHNHRNRNVR